MEKNSSLNKTQIETEPIDSLNWTTVGLVIFIIFVIIGIGFGLFFIVKKISNKRRNHGEYHPQLEESLHAKNLPYISPPNIDGLI